ncbi:MAG TPA: hypothetical protein VGA24_05335 [Steroidobacteraceae bacterium]
MPGSNALQVFRVVERESAGNRLWMRGEGDDRVIHFAVAGFRGPPFPETITKPVLERRDAAGEQSWRLSCDQGRFDFEAQAVERIETRPALYATLHRPFELSTTDRMAVRLLLALLRLPGGPKLLRLWHARRSA